MRLKNALPPCLLSGVLEAGCDEAGRGCLAGPVYAAAVILPEDFADNRVNDSKQMTDHNRREIAEVIRQSALGWGVGIVSAQEIDKINILRASILAMHRALDQIHENFHLDFRHIIVDGNKFYPYKDIPHKTVVKGDGKYASIAAASILAKTQRDQFMEELHIQFPQYHWDDNKGYPTEAHRQAIKEFGPTPYHRKSFRLIQMPSLFD